MKRVPALLCLALLAVSCAPPYFDSPAAYAALIGKLTVEATVGPLSAPDARVQDVYLMFYPQLTDPVATRGIDDSSGFLTWSDKSTVYLAYVSSGATPTQFTGWSAPMNEYSSLLTYRFFALKAPGSVCVVNLDDSNPPAQTSLTYYKADPSTRSFVMTAGPFPMSATLNPAAGFSGDAVGVCSNPALDPTADYGFWLYRSGFETCAEVRMDFRAGGGSAALERPGFSFPGSGWWSHILYFHNSGSTNRSYIQFTGPNNTWTGFWWDSSVVTRSLPAGMHRIDALLSTGQLLSTEGSTGSLYDMDGNLLVSFPLGPLRFVSEEYVDGVPKTIFCQPDVSVDGVYFEVYSIPTVNLKSLASP